MIRFECLMSYLGTFLRVPACYYHLALSYLASGKKDQAIESLSETFPVPFPSELNIHLILPQTQKSIISAWQLLSMLMIGATPGITPLGGC